MSLPDEEVGHLSPSEEMDESVSQAYMASMTDDSEEPPVLHIVEDDIEPVPEFVSEPVEDIPQPPTPSKEPYTESEDNKFLPDIPEPPEMLADTLSSHRSVIVPLPSFLGDNESSVRSESVHSSGSCEREATGSPVLNRRRSTRLRSERPNTRSKSAEKGENETEEDHHEGSETADSRSGTGSTTKKRSNKDKSDYAIRNIAPERQLNPNLNEMWDGFCWRCHKPVPLAEQHGCPSCVRIFHQDCWWNDRPFNGRDVVDTVHAAFGHNLDREADDPESVRNECIECYCILKEEKIKKDDSINNVDGAHSLDGPEKLRKCLQYMMRFVDDHLPPERVRPFAVPVLEQDDCSDSVKEKYAEYITCPMDLRQIGQNIADGKYTTRASFLADLRWILHNTSIFNGQNNRYTRSASYIVETCQHLCYSLEWCPKCFERGMPQNGETISDAVERGMITPCSNPHAVVWVKADKFPIWPAIVYRFNGVMADVRFFGAFEFGAFPKDAIFLFSKSPVTDRRKGRLKLDYECALRQFRAHIAKLRMIPGKELISYPKRTLYDGRLWMFPEGEDPSLATTGPSSINGDVGSYGSDHTGDDEMDSPDAHIEEEIAKPTLSASSSASKLELLISRPRESEKRSRSGSLSDDSSKLSGKRRRGSSPTHIEPNIENYAFSDGAVDVVGSDDAPMLEPPEMASLIVTSQVEISTSPGDLPEPEGMSPNSNMYVADKLESEESDQINPEPMVSPKLEDPISLPATPTETVKPAFFESDSDNDVGDLPSFEFPDDGDDDRVSRPAGKLDHILKRPSITPPEAPVAAAILSGVGLAARNTALTQVLNRPLGPGPTPPGKSVLANALVRPSPALQPRSQPDVFSSMQRARAPSMATGQPLLIEALRSSPRPAGSGDGANQSSDPGRPGRSGSAGSDMRRTPTGREETLGNLLARTQSREFGRSLSASMRQSPMDSLLLSNAANRQILPKPDLPLHDPRSGMPDGRRINAVSTNLIAAARSAQARTNQDMSPGGMNHGQMSPTGVEQNLQRSSILARSLNASSLPSGRSGPTLPGGVLNNGVPSNLRNGGGPGSGQADSNGDRSSPSALQTTMRGLVTARSTHSPVAQDSSLRNITLPANQARRLTPPESPTQMPTESVQAQIDLFLRNTKKIVKDKREETAQVIRETSQTHADNMRLLHDAQLKMQQRTEKATQDLQETMEQSIRKFELLFMVFHNESDFAQKSKILEVSRMKDLERQRAVTSAKRTLWCCVCQKRARLICCGVTMYCSENCHLSNASLHRLHCRRVNSASEDDGNVYTPYGVLVRCSLLPALPDDEEDELDVTGDGNASSGMHSNMNSGNYLSNNGWNNNGRTSADPVEVIDVSQDDDNNHMND